MQHLRMTSAFSRLVDTPSDLFVVHVPSLCFGMVSLSLSFPFLLGPRCNHHVIHPQYLDIIH